MKKIIVLLSTFALLLTAVGCSTQSNVENNQNDNQEAKQEFSMDGFSEWAINGGNAGAYSAGFLGGSENRPSDEEIETILQAANTYFQCHRLTGAHFIVIKNTDEQNNIIPSFYGVDTTGTITVLVLSDGIKDQKHHANSYYPGSTKDNGGNPEYWNMYYGIYETGWASAYLNLAAIEAGYRTRAYAALGITNAESGIVDYYGTGGNFAYIQTDNWDIEKYMSTQDESEDFTHYVFALDEEIPANGNLTLLCAIVIGKIDETDVTTSATGSMDYKSKIRYNYDFWDKDYDPTTQDSTSSASTDANSGSTSSSEE